MKSACVCLSSQWSSNRLCRTWCRCILFHGPTGHVPPASVSFMSVLLKSFSNWVLLPCRKFHGLMMKQLFSHNSSLKRLELAWSSSSCKVQGIKVSAHFILAKLMAWIQSNHKGTVCSFHLLKRPIQGWHDDFSSIYDASCEWKVWQKCATHNMSLSPGLYDNFMQA